MSQWSSGCGAGLCRLRNNGEWCCSIMSRDYTRDEHPRGERDCNITVKQHGARHSTIKPHQYSSFIWNPFKLYLYKLYLYKRYYTSGAVGHPMRQLGTMCSLASRTNLDQQWRAIMRGVRRDCRQRCLQCPLSGCSAKAVCTMGRSYGGGPGSGA